MLDPFFKLLPLKAKTGRSEIICWTRSFRDLDTTGLMSRHGVGGVTNQEHMPFKFSFPLIAKKTYTLSHNTEGES